MSQIPVGSPKPPPGRHAAPGGWYPDPVDPRRERWWDGWQWSRDVREAEAPAQPQPVAAARPGQPALTADGVPLAGWWHRAGAIVVDGLLLGVVTSLLSLPFLQTAFDAVVALFDASLEAARQGQPPPPQPDPTSLITPTETLALGAVQLLCGLAYHGLFLRLRSATPGKLLLGLRVVPVDRGRSTERLGWRAALLRALVWVAPAVVTWLFVLRLVDVVLPLTNPRRQALHDLAARTQVVRTR
ncbi:RDD family protein [Auraticoccus cholistanensis]|uniref:RDD family protein n=1 Tax=Auraticoccus cholistanensis TaxID=2656650 RepID=UPI0018D23257